MAKKSAKKNSKKNTPKPAAQPIDPTLEQLRDLLGMAETQDRSGGGPQFPMVQKGLIFSVEDAVIGLVTKKDDSVVNVITLTLLGLDGDNEGKTHVDKTWLERDDRDNVKDPMWSINKAKTDIEILGGVWPDKDSIDPLGEITTALEAITGAKGIGDTWKKDEYMNFGIKDRAEQDSGDEEEITAEPDEPSIAEDDIRAMSEDKMDQAAKDNDIDPDDYETYDLLAEKLIELLC